MSVSSGELNWVELLREPSQGIVAERGIPNDGKEFSEFTAEGLESAQRDRTLVVSLENLRLKRLGPIHDEDLHPFEGIQNL